MSGKTVLVTGASRGIGATLATAYATAGVSKIALAARGSLEETQAAVLKAAKIAGKPEPTLLLLKLDVSDAKSVEAVAKEVQQRFKTVDVLVNNAGYLEPVKFIADSDPEEWWRSFEVNLRGPYLMTKAFLPFLTRNEGDRQIVNISSVGAIMVIPGMSSYNTTKHALMRLTESINAEYAGQGVLTFAVHPGGVSTELSRSLPEQMHIRRFSFSILSTC